MVVTWALAIGVVAPEPWISAIVFVGMTGAALGLGASAEKSSAFTSVSTAPAARVRLFAGVTSAMSAAVPSNTLLEPQPTRSATYWSRAKAPVPRS